MTIKISSTVELNPVLLIVEAGVRYWEDAEVNGRDDEDGSLIPLRSRDLWCPTIELATGRVLEWPIGTTAKIHYKICDAGEYFIEDAEGRRLRWKGYYVPDILAVDDDAYGDYIILTIGADGIIERWKEPVLSGEEWEAVE